MLPPQIPRQKLYCYVDETGQDARSRIFIVVAVVSSAEQDPLREALVCLEQFAGVRYTKWHNSKPERRERYIELAMQRRLGHGEVFYCSYAKPVSFFLPVLDLLERAIQAFAEAAYTARVFVDGIDRKKSIELKSALRLRGVSVESVKGRRDESEPIIRMADMWAGCIRAAIEGRAKEQVLLKRALDCGYIRSV